MSLSLRVAPGCPCVMGILNITPDSFSDGGRYYAGGAVEHALEMVDSGAGIVDVGGESTRPGSLPIPAEDEISRIVPVIKALSEVSDITISVGTVKTDVARAALDAGADIINDVNGLRSEGMAELAAEYGVPVIIMHMHGSPKDMQDCPISDDAADIVSGFFRERTVYAESLGIKDVILDPGIGFGKTYGQNMELIDRIREYSMGYPVLIGASRKSFLSKIYPDIDPDDATAMVSVRAADAGASILRVHDVRKVCAALRGRV